MIKHAELVEACRPLLSLAGSEPEAIMAEGFNLTFDELKFLSAVEVPGVQPIEYHGMWVWPVSVEVERP